MHFSTKMKKNLFQNIEIPENIELTIEGSEIIVKGPIGENKRAFNFGKLEIKKDANKIVIGSKKATKREKKYMNTIAAHLRNMIKGAGKKFEYELKVCFSHFPMSVELKNNEAIIKNFLGEKIPRKMKLPEGVEVKANKDIITISSSDKELAGQVATNFEKITRAKGRDLRVFQDGIYIIKKPGREI